MKLTLLAIVVFGAAHLVAAQNRKIMIFGGQDHKTYLGCLNCSKFAADSVFNKFGDHGSKYSSDSIFNTFGDFGGKFSDYSPCNQFASQPPVIVDERGNYYGELTVNTSDSRRSNSEALNGWIEGVCSSD